VADRRERRAAFESGECELVVERTFEAETLAAFGLEPPGEDRGDGAIVVVEVDDVAAAHEAVVAGGAGEALFEPRTVEWGREMFLARDPDGYVVEVSRPVDDED
jgi:predicted enzyme related to lactoylglutathione lyase